MAQPVKVLTAQNWQPEFIPRFHRGRRKPAPLTYVAIVTYTHHTRACTHTDTHIHVHTHMHTHNNNNNNTLNFKKTK